VSVFVVFDVQIGCVSVALPSGVPPLTRTETKFTDMYAVARHVRAVAISGSVSSETVCYRLPAGPARSE
jgi:hypothetical protein